MATKKTSRKKATKKPAKKTASKAPRKVAKKAVKKTTKKAPRKATSRAAKKSTRQAGSSVSPAFPSLETEERQDDFYSSVGSESYSSMGSGMTDVSQPEEEGSSRNFAITAILVIAVVIIFVVVAKDLIFPGKKGKPDEGKKIEAVKKDDKKVEDKKQPPAVPVKKDGYRTHTVAKGDTLAGIARKYKVKNWRSIMKLNKMKSPRDAKPGRVLKIPHK